MESEAVISEGLTAMVSGAVGANVLTLRILAERGLMKPDELELIARALTAPFEAFRGSEHHEQFRAIIERKFEPELASILQLARMTWREPPATEGTPD
jgi:hypothetical protein